MLLHLLLDKKDAVQVVGHHLKSQYLHLGMTAGNLAPTTHDFLPKRCEMHVRSIAMPGREARVS